MSSVKPPSGLPPSRSKQVVPPSGPPPSARKKVAPPPRSERTKETVPSSRRRRKDSSSSSSSDSDNEGWTRLNPNGNEYSEGKARRQLKKHRKNGAQEVPTKDNAYLGMRMSAVLRGERDDLPQLGDFLYEEELSDYEPDGFIDGIKHAWFVKSKEKKFAPRFMLAIFAVLLLWISSAAACRGVITVIIQTPLFSEIETTVLNAQNVSTTQRDNYLACVEELFVECNLTFTAQMENEGLRLNLAQEANNQIIASEEAVLGTCRSAMEDGLAQIDNLNNFNIVDFFVANPPAECEQLEDLFATEIQSLEAINTAQASADDSTETVDNFEAQLRAREAYDREYQENITAKFGDAAANLRESLYDSADFRGDIDTELNNLRACLVEDGVLVINETIFVCENGFVDEGRNLIADFENEFDRMNTTVEAYLDDVRELQETAEALSNLVGAATFDIANLPGINVGNLEAAMRIGLNNIGISDEEIDAFVAAREAELLEQIENAEAELAAVEAEIAAKQQEFLDNATREFNEAFPGIDPNVLQSADDARGAADALSGQVAEDLDSVNDNAGEVEQPNTDFDGILISTDVDFIQGLEDRGINFFAYDDDVFLNLEGQIDTVLSYVLAFDTFWRIMQSILLFKKYWGISAIATPPGDVRSDKGMLFKEKKGPLQAVGGILANPVVQVIYNLIVIFSVSIFFYLAYEPLLEEFEEGCLNANFNDINNGNVSGTMIFNNLNSMSISFVTSPGDAKVTELVDTLNLQRGLACSDLFQDSVNVRQDQIDVHSLLKRNFNTLASDYNLFSTCVDWVSVDANFGSNLNNIYTEPECNRVIEEIVVDDSVLHSCDNVAKCNQNCAPDFNAIGRESHNAGCTTEFAMHSYFLVGFLTAAMYICLNLSRFYLINGILEVNWPTLCIGVFSYLLSCTERGTIIPPEEVEEGEPFSEVIERALTVALRKFTMKGYLDLFFAAMINLPWIVFLITFSRLGSFSNAPA